ncbi:MAG TPA: DUF2914 domain-containing protein [Vicinamibacterales bacterium]|nr:DUF2914 domain-containing protein [Vicinamibacterales bacterium]
MREPDDAQSIIEAAKEAAAANDYASAEALLRKAVLVQETELGPMHPDLASTVNNLGIVCEINEKPADAEACFRRAYTIATHSLSPDHPMVTTSRQNLRDFCAARGMPFELPKPVPAVTAPEQAPPEAAAVATPVETRPDAAAIATPVTAPPDAAAVTTPVKAPPDAAAVTTPVKARPDAAAVATPVKARPDAAVVTTPVKTRPDAAAVTTPAKTRPDAAAVTTPAKTRPNPPAVQTPTKARSDAPTDQPRRASPVVPRAVPARARTRLTRALVMGGLGPVAMLIVIVAARPWLGSTEGHESAAPAMAPTAPAVPEPPPVPPAVEPTPVATESTHATTESPKATAEAPKAAAEAPKATAEATKAAKATAEAAKARTETTKVTESRPAVKADDRRTIETSTPARLVVVRAQLCAELVDWHCDPPDRPIPSGQLFFYTQVKVARATTVQHRWYQGERLQHSVDLRVDASPDVGYRSFSRYTMKGENAGTWRVELRTADGVLLQQERFSVQ